MPISYSFLSGAIKIFIICNKTSVCSCFDIIFSLLSLIKYFLYLEFACITVVRVVLYCEIVFTFNEIWQNFFIGPTFIINKLCPIIIVPFKTTDINHCIHGTWATQHFASRLINCTVIEVWFGFSFKILPNQIFTE